ncbi:MAG: hypothetical protein ACO39R_06510, partial [Pontimonas sp.]
MTLPSVELSPTPLAELAADAIVLGVTPGDDGLEIADPSLSDEDRSWLLSAAEAVGMKATADEVRSIPSPAHWSARTVVLVGVSSNVPDAAAVRYAAGAGVRAAGQKATIALSLPGEGP